MSAGAAGDPVAIAGVADLIGEHDLFMVDQFGVLHDGATPYPGAVDTLQRLTAAGKTVVLISNSGKRAAENEARLSTLGVPRDSYHAFISSGEVAWRLIADGGLPIDTSPPIRCLLVNRRGDRSAVAGLKLDLIDHADAADLILLTGSDGDRLTLDHYRGLLAPAAARGVPCLCTNPDRIMVLPGGTGYAPGAIADLYAELGGPVTWIGKPHAEIYRFALDAVARLGLTVPPHARIIGIGDSIEHDIAGAKRAGFAAALVTAGIHAADDDNTLHGIMRSHQAWPEYRMRRLVWAA